MLRRVVFEKRILHARLFSVHLRLAVSGTGLLIRRSLVRAQVEEPNKALWALESLLLNR